MASKMMYKFIENLARLIMEWAARKQYDDRLFVDEIADTFSHRALKGLRVK